MAIEAGGLLREWAEWIVGIAGTVFVAVQTRTFFWHREMIQKIREPDRHGLGSLRTNELICSHLAEVSKTNTAINRQLEELNRHQKQVVHYTKWLVTTLSDQKPPPPMDDT